MFRIRFLSSQEKIMKKIFVVISFLFLNVGLLFAQYDYAELSSDKINVLPSYTTMLMDSASYGSTVYEAVLASDTNDFSNGSPIFINKYVKNQYESTLRIDLEEFKNYEFDENYSHYDFLKLYAIGPDEIILTVYYCFSTNRFVFFRIKNGQIVCSKAYSLKNQHAYEEQCYAFNGSDRVYVAFNGQKKFDDTGWDLFLMAFDLDGNLVKSVTVFTKENDELTGLSACGDYVYFSIRRSFEKQAIVQFSKDLEYNNLWAHKYADSGIRLWTLDSDGKNLFVTVYMENDNTDYIARYSADGKFICCYSMDENCPALCHVFAKKKFTDEGISFFGKIYTEGDFMNPEAKIHYLEFFMDWDGNKIYEREFAEWDNLDFRNFEFVDGKYFCMGENIYNAEGVGHISYNYLVENIYRDTYFMYFKKTAFNPFASPVYIEDNGFGGILNPFVARRYCESQGEIKRKYESEKKYWLGNLNVQPEEIPGWEFDFAAQIIRLDFAHARPDSDEITDSIPLFPFSER